MSQAELEYFKDVFRETLQFDLGFGSQSEAILRFLFYFKLCYPTPSHKKALGRLHNTSCYGITLES